MSFAPSRAVALLFLLFMVGHSVAQPFAWKLLDVPDGEPVLQLQLLSNGDVVALAAHPFSGSPHVYRSADDGRTWQREGMVWTETTIGTDGTLFVSQCVMEGPFHSSPCSLYAHISTDLGRTWGPIAVDSLDDGGPIVPASFHAAAGGRVFAMTEAGLYASDSAGRQWREVFFDADSVQAPSRLALAGGTGGLLVAFTSDSVYVSEDNGTTWIRHAVETGQRTGLSFQMIAVIDASRFAAFDGESIWHSGDGGRTWEKRNSPMENPSALYELRALDDGRLYLGSLEGGFVSDDGGETWTKLTPESTSSVLSFVRTQAGTLLSATETGVYRSGADGTWAPSMAGLDQTVTSLNPLNDGSLIITTSRDEIYRSADQGATWDRLPSPSTDPLSSYLEGIAEGQGGGLFSYATSLEPAVHHLAPGDTTWTALGLRGIASLVVTSRGTLVAAPLTQDEFFRSVDGGETWQIIDPAQLFGSATLLATDAADRIYAGGYIGLHRSTDDGLTWERVFEGYVVSLETVGDGQVVVTTLDGQIFRSQEAGISWERLSTPGKVRDVLATPGQTMFANGGDPSTSISDHSLLRSKDLGLTWEFVDAPWPPEDVQVPYPGLIDPFPGSFGQANALARDMDGYLYARAYGLLWRSEEAIATSQEPMQSMPRTLRVEVYPNPFARIATISYTMVEAGPMRISVFDVTGRAVATLVDGVAVAGPHEVRFDASDMPAGVYFCRLEAGGRRAARVLVRAR